MCVQDLVGAMWEGWLQKKLHVDLSWKDEVRHMHSY